MNDCDLSAARERRSRFKEVIGMVERLPGIYEIDLKTDTGVTNEMHVFLIPGKPGERSLMIDTGYRKKNCLQTMNDALEELGVDCKNLDIFLTHKHHDHTGLVTVFKERGASVFMNPEENRHPYDCLYYNQNQSVSDLYQVIRSVGITREKTPEIWDMFMEIRRRVEENKGWEYEVPQFDFIPVTAGQRFEAGGYSLEAIRLKGHTYGQMGLFEREKRLVFSADQIIDGIVPIVGTTYPDEHLLEGYFASLEEMKHTYRDCLFLPAHKTAFTDVTRVANRIVFSYLDKADMIKRILDHSRRRMMIREVAMLAYGMEGVPRDMTEFVKLKMVMSKTFSCLEYLRDEDFAIRSEEDGIFYWQSAKL